MEKEDNSGRKIISIIEKDSKNHLETTYSRHLIDELVEEHDDLKISHDCGNFVCNETYFRTLSAEIEIGEKVLKRFLFYSSIYHHLREFRLTVRLYW